MTASTPNTHIALLDYEPAPIICELRGLPEKLIRRRWTSSATSRWASSSSARVVLREQRREERCVRQQRSADPRSLPRRSAPTSKSRASGQLHRGRAQPQSPAISAPRSWMATTRPRSATWPISPTGWPADARGSDAGGSEGQPEWSDCYERFGEHLAANGVDLAKTPRDVRPLGDDRPEDGGIHGRARGRSGGARAPQGSRALCGAGNRLTGEIAGVESCAARPPEPGGGIPRQARRAKIPRSATAGRQAARGHVVPSASVLPALCSPMKSSCPRTAHPRFRLLLSRRHSACLRSVSWLGQDGRPRPPTTSWPRRCRKAPGRCDRLFELR